MLALSSAVMGAAVAQDAFAAAAMYGTRDRTKRMRPVWITAAIFALFQMLMPMLGWSIGKAGSSAVSGFDHIIAFGILSFIGIKMMLDSKLKINDGSKDNDVMNFRSLLSMAFATSIDALTVGITLPSAVGANSFSQLLTAVSIIGSVTFLISFTGYLLGRKLSRLNPSAAQVIGGAALTALGIKTLITG